MPRVNTGPKLRPNPSGFWEIHWTENGRSKRASTRTKDRQQAQQVLAGFLTGRAEDDGGPLLVSSVWSDYEAEHVIPNIADPRSPLRAGKLLVQFFGDMDVRDIQPANVLEYRRRRLVGLLAHPNGRKVTPPSLRVELSYLRAAINHAVKHKRLASTDAPNIDMPDAPPPREKFLTEAQEADFLAKLAAVTEAKGRVDVVHLFAAIALDTASRRTAVTTLRWDQIDFEAGLIDFRDRERRRRKKRRVPVPISQRLLPLLERARAENPTAEFVTPREIAPTFRRRMRQIGYPWVTPHTLRHTWGTLSARAGKSLYEIAGVMGDTLATVEANYLHHCPEHLRAAVERGDAKKGGGMSLDQAIAAVERLSPEDRAALVANFSSMDLAMLLLGAEKGRKGVA